MSEKKKKKGIAEISGCYFGSVLLKGKFRENWTVVAVTLLLTLLVAVKLCYSTPLYFIMGLPKGFVNVRYLIGHWRLC